MSKAQLHKPSEFLFFGLPLSYTTLPSLPQLEAGIRTMSRWELENAGKKLQDYPTGVASQR